MWRLVNGSPGSRLLALLGALSDWRGWGPGDHFTKCFWMGLHASQHIPLLPEVDFLYQSVTASPKRTATGSVMKRVIPIVFSACRRWDSVVCNKAQKRCNIPRICPIVLSVHLNKLRPAPILHLSDHNAEVRIQCLWFSTQSWILPIELKGPRESVFRALLLSSHKL